MQMNQGPWIVTSTLLVACSGAPTDGVKDAGGGAKEAGSNACAARSGVFNYQETFVSGTCGDAIAPASFNISDLNGPQKFAIPFILGEKPSISGTVKVADYSPNCTGSVIISTDNCGIEYSLACPSNSVPGSFMMVGKITWSNDGKSGQASYTYTVFDAASAAVCSGQHKVTVAK